jgi:hypothetical protein
MRGALPEVTLLRCALGLTQWWASSTPLVSSSSNASNRRQMFSTDDDRPGVVETVDANRAVSRLTAARTDGVVGPGRSRAYENLDY